MSPRKLTEDDKQEILQLYRNSEATTSTLANHYEVSSSTISRFLKNKLSSTEYEDLIQQKRLARTPRGEKASVEPEISDQKTKVTKSKKNRQKSLSTDNLDSEKIAENVVTTSDIELTESVESVIAETTAESKALPTRRRRRRSAVSDELEVLETTVPTTIEAENPEELPEEQPETLKEEKPKKLVIEPKINETVNNIASNNDSDKILRSSSLILKNDKLNSLDSLGLEIEEDDDEVDLMTLKEMLGEDLQDINDDEDDDDEDDDDEDDDADWKETLAYSKKDSSFTDVEILPLSQATFPRICYLVIDRAAELIVKPLAEFADLGEIPQDEIRQRTLPVFDNHRIAKRFSHRRERVIKVPDGRMLQKTSRHLQEKGITRLLIDGHIYSLLS
jgi:transposase-like protein